MSVSRRRTGVAGVGLLAALVLAPAARAAISPLQHLRPGSFADIHQRVPVTARDGLGRRLP